MRGRSRSPIDARALALVCLAALLTSCGGRSPAGERPAILSSPLGPVLTRMCEASGGLDAYRRVESVRFVYEAELGPAARWPDLLGPSGSRPEGRPPRIGPLRVSFRLDDRSRLLVEGPDGPREVVLEGPVRPTWEDYALRSARVLLFFPFALLEPGWEFRREAAGSRDPDLVWAIPPRGAAPHSAYSFSPDRKKGLVERIACGSGHPVLAGGPALVSFKERRTSAGLSIPTEIVHVALGGREPLYPWEPDAGGGPAGEALVLRARISDIVLVERPAAPPRPPPAQGDGR